MNDRAVASDPPWLVEATEKVQSAQVVAIAFERLFGLAADALDPAAVDQVVAIKGRPDRGGRVQPIAVILPDRDAVALVAPPLPPLARRLADAHWPGLLTLLVPALDGLPPALVGDNGLIGVRLPGPCPAATLARASDRVLTATSANLSGGADILSQKDLSDLKGVSFTVKGEVAGPPGSTVVDASGERPVVIRAGAMHL